MEANTVILDLEEYIKLREFKENIEKGLVPVKTYYNGIPWCYTYISKDEALNMLAKDNKTLQQEIIKMKKERKVRKSLWQFFKWKRSIK